MLPNQTQFELTEKLFKRKKRVTTRDFIKLGITRMSQYVLLMRQKYGTTSIQMRRKSNGTKRWGEYTFTNKRGTKSI